MTNKSEVTVPDHYKLKGLNCESIDIIKAVVSDLPGWRGFCRGAALKYLIRADHKGGIRDLKKALDFIQWEIDSWGGEK